MKARWEGRLYETKRRIAEAELRTSALTQTVIALMKAGGDTGETQQCLWAHMDELNALRHKRALFERLRQDKLRAAIRAQPKERGS